MKILITGATGFLGTALKHHIRRRTFPNVDVYTFQTSSQQDIRNQDQIDFATKNKDLVINLAALSHVDYSWIDPKIYYETNAIGATMVMESCLKNKVKMIHISTSEVYGTNTKPGIPMTENHPLQPHYPYSEAKALADWAAQNRIRAYNQDIVILRPFNQYGTGAFQTVEKLIPKFVKQAINNEDLTIYGDGNSTRDWVFVEDTVRAIWMAKDLSPGVYNISTGQAYSVKDIAKLVMEHFPESRSSIVFNPFPTERPNEVKELLGDSTKIRNALGWAPEINLPQGISLSVRFYSTIKPVYQNYTPGHIR